MTQLCFVRHGETDWNYQQLIQGNTDIPLNSKGIAQAREVAKHLSEERWDHIYASPLGRAHTTAAFIAEAVGLETLHTDGRLKERNFGEAEGVSIEEYHSTYKHRPLNGIETWEEVRKRAFEASEEIAHRHPNSRIIVVAHGGLIASLLHVISEGEIGMNSPPLKNACMSLFTHHKDQWHIEWYNRVAPELETVTG